MVVVYWYPLDAYICMNNPLNTFITVQEMDFLIIWLIILISIVFLIFLVYCWRSSAQKILEKLQTHATYTHYIISKFQLNPFTTAQEMDFLIMSSLFSFLYLTGEVANEEFWKNHRVLLHTPIMSYLNFSSIRSLRCVHTMPCGRMQHTAALPCGKSCSAYAANLIVTTLKKNFS